MTRLLSLLLLLGFATLSCTAETSNQEEDTPTDQAAQDLSTDVTPGEDSLDQREEIQEDLEDVNDLEDQADTSAPLRVSILPEEPRTLDDLQAEISIDEEGFEISQYWQREGEEHHEEILPASMTTKGQTWTLRVVAQRGEARLEASDSVTILNTPPILKSCGFDRYLAYDDSIIQLVSGAVEDPDEEATGLEVSWYLNDTLLEWESEISLDLSNHDAADTTLRAEVRAKDNEESGPLLEIGPIQVLPAAPHWEQLSPQLRTSEFFDSAWTYDPAHRRILYLDQGELWELPLDTNTTRWVKLDPHWDADRGNSPLLAQLQLFPDKKNKRILAIGNLDDEEGMEVFELDTSRRGAERWRKRTPLGESLPEGFYTSGFHDSEANLAIFGMVNLSTGTVDDQLWAFDYNNPGGEKFIRVQLNTPLASPHLFGHWLHTSGSSEALLIGGMDETNQPTTHATRLSWTQEGEQIIAETQTLDLGLEEMPIHYLFTPSLRADQAHILTYGDEEDTLLTRIDLGDKSITHLGPAPTTGAATFLSYTEDGHLLFSRYLETYVPEPAGIGLAFFDLSLQSPYNWTLLSQNGVTTPPPTRDAQIWSGSGEALLLNGRFNGTHSEDIYHLDLETQLWSIMNPPAPSPMDGAPLVRWETSGTSSGRLLFFGGEGESGSLSDGWALEKKEETWSWTRLEALTGPTPDPRANAMAWDPKCQDDELVVAGGTTSSTAIWVLRCSPDCEWAQYPSNAAQLEESAYAEGATSDEIISYGGSAGGDTVDTLRVINRCPEDDWDFRVLNPTGESPGARVGHALVREPSGPHYLLMGEKLDSTTIRQNDVWALDAIYTPYEEERYEYSWRKVDVQGDRPSARTHGAAFWDRTNKRIVYVGGADSLGPNPEVWAFYP